MSTIRTANRLPSLAGAVLLSFWSTDTASAASYLNVTLQGSFQRDNSEIAKTSRTSLSGELGIPITNFLEISAGQSILMSKTTYNSEYRDWYIGRTGLMGLPAQLVKSDEIYDTSINVGLGYPIAAFRPSIFGGKLWRKVCSEDFLADQGCNSEPNSWNAGIALSVHMTLSLRLRLSYRISPSARTDEKKTYDDQTSVGLTWEI